MTYVFDMSIEKRGIQGGPLEFYDRITDLQHRVDIEAALREGVRFLEPHEMPTKLRLKMRRKVPPDTFSTAPALYVVCKPIRDIIEELDPGVHQTWPVRLWRTRKEEIDGSWWGLNVTAEQNSIVFEKSSVRRNDAQFPKLNHITYVRKNVTVDPKRLSGLNFWREERVDSSLFGSDRLIEMLKERGLRFFQHFKAHDLT